MATVFIPTILRAATGGVPEVEVTGTTLQEVLDDLERQHPGIRDRVVEGGAFRPEVFVAIDGDEAFGLAAPVQPNSEVRILPAIAGGALTTAAVPLSIGADLRRCRQEANITQAQLARAAGISQARLSRIETGQIVPRIEQLQRLCDALDAVLAVQIHPRAAAGTVRRTHR